MALGYKDSYAALSPGKKLLIRITALYTLASCSAMLLTGAISILFLSPLVLAIVIRLIRPEKVFLNLKNWSWVEIILSVVILAFAMGKILMFRGELLSTLSETLIIYQLLKWLSDPSERDFFILSGVAYIEVLAAASMTTNVAFMPVFILFTLLNTFVMFMIFLTGERDGGSEKHETYAPVHSNLLMILGSFSLISLIITITLFFFFPRMGAGLYSRSGGTRETLPGSNGIIDLRDNTFNLPDTTVVARIKSEKPLSPPLYLKTISLVRYENDSWSSQRAFHPLKGEKGQFIVSGGRPSEPSQVIEVFLDLMGQTRIPFIPGTEEIFWNWGRLFSNGEGDIMFSKPITHPVKYRLSVSSRDRHIGNELAPYLSLKGVPEEIYSLARSLETRGLSGKKRSSLVREYVSSSYRYSRSPGDVSLTAFLRGEKQGNCQHFATSTALTLRAMGMPARIAGGFISSEFNSLGGYWVFRKENAHAWAETYVEGKGWDIIDSTPPVVGTLNGNSPIAQLTDWARHKWNEYIIGYDLKKQLAISKNVIRGSLTAGKKLTRGFRGNRETVAIIIIIILLSILIGRKLNLNRSNNRARTRPGKLNRRYFAPLIDRGKKLGVTIKPTETPREYLFRLVNETSLEEKKAVAFSTCYNRIRYGSPTAEELTDMERLLKDVLLELKK